MTAASSQPPHSLWRLRSVTLEAATPLIMGIVNVTPDSFSDGGSFLAADQAIAHAHELVGEGAHIVDVGGESTRPGAADVPVAEELSRVIPVIKELAAADVVVSVDTSKVEVAAAAIDAGAQVINDVTGFQTEPMQEIAAEAGCGVVVMHMAGTPRTMQENPLYVDVVAEVGSFLVRQAELLQAAGVDADRICVDPGIGFGKTTAHNLMLLSETRRLAEFGYPLMVGASRKRFLGEVAQLGHADERDGISAVLAGIVGFLGANVLRVHDVKATKEAVLLSSAIVSST